MRNWFLALLSLSLVVLLGACMTTQERRVQVREECGLAQAYDVATPEQVACIKAKMPNDCELHERKRMTGGGIRRCPTDTTRRFIHSTGAGQIDSDLDPLEGFVPGTNPYDPHRH